MLEIGKINQLRVADQLPFGFYLEDETQQRILLPNRAAPEDCKIDDLLEVFVYHDSDNRLIATTLMPDALLGQVARLRVKTVSDIGAFVDWGLDKDLFVPLSEQSVPMSEKLSYVVYVFQDPLTQRLTGTTKLRKHLSETGDDLVAGTPVELMIYGQTDLGFKAVINGSHLGLLFKDEVFKPLRIGDKTDGFIKHIREDSKIDLSLQQHNRQARRDLTEQILDDLIAHGGLSTLTDKSPPEEISQRFAVSKNAYKKALGALFKQKKILISRDRISLVSDE